ncbi:MAG: hypothetical protein OT477_04620 [Chloroflexi bacterium]|nr:hypothetical protein [Chloroflexota bacterium]
MTLNRSTAEPTPTPQRPLGGVMRAQAQATAAKHPRQSQFGGSLLSTLFLQLTAKALPMRIELQSA